MVLLVAATYVHADLMTWWLHHPIHQVPQELQVPTGNELSFHAVGVGVQIYVWTASATDPTQFSWGSRLHTPSCSTAVSDSRTGVLARRPDARQRE
jgi:hypothetical protein